MTPLEKRIDLALRSLPHLAVAPSSHWALWAQNVSDRLQMKIGVSLSAEGWQATPQTHMGRSPVVLPLSIASQPGNAAWVMSRPDTAKLSAWLLGEQALKRVALSEEFQEGFLRFMALEVAREMKAPVVFSEEELRERAYCIDLALQFQETQCIGRIAISEKLHDIWRAHEQESPLLPRISAAEEVPVAIRIGTLLLSAEELQAAQPGDALILPPGSWDPRHEIGEATLLVGTHPIARVRLSSEKAERLDTPLVETLGLHVESDPFSLPLSALQETTFATPLTPNSTFSIRKEGVELARAQLLYLGEIPCLQVV